jgi:hypothetical protein
MLVRCYRRNDGEAKGRAIGKELEATAACVTTEMQLDNLAAELKIKKTFPEAVSSKSC